MVIFSLESVFFLHSIPAVLMSENGPQFDSSVMKTFAKNCGFNHNTSSIHSLPTAQWFNGRTVNTIKALLRHTDDPYLALLSYRSTPLPWCSYIPSELSMGI